MLTERQLSFLLPSDLRQNLAIYLRNAFFSLPLLFSACTKDTPCTTCPPPAKDPRTYTWSVDTITYPGSYQTIMRSIWGSGPNDVYIAGHNDNPGPPTLFHFNGQVWSTTGFHAREGGTISGAVSLTRVYGFGQSDVWVAGERIYQVGNTFPDSSFLMHFNGAGWNESPIAGGRGRQLQSLWGATPTDIWAGGVNTLLHYDGVQWSHYPIEMPAQGIQFLSIAGLSPTEVYTIGSRKDVAGPIDTIAYLMYQYDGTIWHLRDSTVWTAGSEPRKFGPLLGAVDGALFSVLPDVYEYSSGTWNRIYTPSSQVGGIGGNRRTSLFTAGSEVFHFNGQDWYRYPQFQNPDIWYYSIWTTGDEVFLVGADAGRSFVARGR